MSELSNKIKTLRGNKTAEEAAEICHVSRESFYRCERGGSVKYATLKKIAKGFKLSDADWHGLLVAWLRFLANDDAQKIWIETKESSPLNELDDAQVAKAMMLFEKLNSNERGEILNAMQRKEVVACLPAINRVWDKFDKK